MSSNNKIIFLGDSAVGKTSIILYMSHKWCKVEPTVAVDQFLIEYDNQKIMVFDTAGQERYRSLVPLYMRGASIAIIVFSVDDENTFNSIKSYYENFRAVESEAKVILVGNKIDLEQTVSENEIQNLADELDCPYVLTSATNGTNIESLTECITNLLKDMSKGIPNDLDLKLDQDNANKNNNCC